MLHDITQILLLYVINYFHKFKLDIGHFSRTLFSIALHETAHVAAICFILSLVLLLQACAIYQKKGIRMLHNIVVTFIYRKTPSKGRNPQAPIIYGGHLGFRPIATNAGIFGRDMEAKSF